MLPNCKACLLKCQSLHFYCMCKVFGGVIDALVLCLYKRTRVLSQQLHLKPLSCSKKAYFLMYIHHAGSIKTNLPTEKKIWPSVFGSMTAEPLGGISSRNLTQSKHGPGVPTAFVWSAKPRCSNNTGSPGSRRSYPLGKSHLNQITPVM